MHSAGDRQDLCNWDIILKGAKILTVFSYLYDDIGNYALTNVQLSGSSAVTKHPR